MDSVQQAILLFKTLILIAPPAMYFVVLGLLNCQPTPSLVNARRDFLALTAVLAPLLLAPIPSLVLAGHAWLLLPGLILLALGMRALLPAADGGWVMYNLSAVRARALVERCLGELGWAYEVLGDRLEVPQRSLTIRLAPVPGLRNVTCHLDYRFGADRAHTTRALHQALSRSLARQQQLPSLGGASLLIVGVGLMILPLWMMSRHSDAVAEVVTRLLLS